MNFLRFKKITIYNASYHERTDGSLNRYVVYGVSLFIYRSSMWISALRSAQHDRWKILITSDCPAADPSMRPAGALYGSACGDASP